MALGTQDLLNLKDAIEEGYTDGISAIISAELNEDGAIVGIFKDGRKQYEYTVDPDEDIPERQLMYKLLNPDVVNNDRIDWDPGWLYEGDRFDSNTLVSFIEMGMRVDAKKNCTKGTACGASCIPASRTCRKKDGLSDQGKAKAKAVKEKLKKEPASKKEAKAKKEAVPKAEKSTKATKESASKASTSSKGSDIDEKDPKGVSYSEKLGTAAELRKGKPIKSQEEFDYELNRAFDAITSEFPTYEKLVPIAALREALGDRLSRGEFNDFLKNQYDKGYMLIGGEAPGSKYYSSQDLQAGAYSTQLGGPKFYIQRERGSDGKPVPRTAPTGTIEKTSQPKQATKSEPKTETKPKASTASTKSRDTSSEKDSKGVRYSEKLGSAAELRKGKPITSKKEFEADFDKALESLDQEFGYDNLVPIAAIREALGNRVSRSAFNEYMLDLQAEDKTVLIGGEAPGGKYYSSQDLQSDGISTRLGGNRFYVRNQKKQNAGRR